MNEEFYDNSILLGTKISERGHLPAYGFYDNSILLGTKMIEHEAAIQYGFTITQFF